MSENLFIILFTSNSTAFWRQCDVFDSNTLKTFETCCNLAQGSENFFIKGQIINNLGFVGDIVSVCVTTTQLDPATTTIDTIIYKQKGTAVF